MLCNFADPFHAQTARLHSWKSVGSKGSETALKILEIIKWPISKKNRMFNVDQNRDMCYLCRWALQRIVVQNDALKVSEIAVAYRDCCYLVTGKIEPDQWQLSQLCKPNQHRNDTSTRKHHSFHTGAGACDSDQEAGERGGFCGCWGHVELPADRSVEEESGSHYSWRPWRERERVMCMSEKKFEDKLEF